MLPLEFFQAVLPDIGPYCLVLFPHGAGAKKHMYYNSLERMAVKAALYDAEYEAVYFACAAGTPLKGEARANKHSPDWRAQALWMDLDCGGDKPYATKADAAKALAGFCTTLQLPFPMLVDSGNGLHCYWRLDRAINYAEWRPLAEALKRRAIEHGLELDRQVTADAARILRPVGTTNRKLGEKRVRVVRASDVLTVPHMVRVLEPEADTYTADPNLNDDLTSHAYPDLPKSAELVATKCAQVAKMRDTQGDVSYDHWFGVIGLIKHCTEGLDLALKWSEQRAATGHVQTNTEFKYESWGAGPTTCESFENRNPGGCKGCPHAGKVKSPIQLGLVAPENVETVVEVQADGVASTVVVPALPHGYTWDGKLLTRLIKVDDQLKPISFTHTLFYPIYRVRHDDVYGIGIRMHLPKGNRIREFEIDTKSIASTNDLLKELAHKGEIVTTNNKDAGGHITAYMRDSLEELKRQADELHTMVRYGWSEGMDTFLIGNRLYMADGEIRRVMVGGAAAEYLADFPEPRGTVEHYADALNFVYNREGYEHLQYIVCSGFGSILTPLGEKLYHGLLLAVSSKNTAKGKTSACHASMYAFGDASRMTIPTKNGATANALTQRMGVYNNLPILFDEFTHLKPEELSELAYKISTGKDKARLESSGRGVRKAAQLEWDLSPFISGNVDFYATLGAHMANSQAEGVRIVQVRVDDRPLLDFAPGEVDAAMTRMHDNRGMAGDRFLRYVVQNLAEVRDLFKKVSAEIGTHVTGEEYRFFRNQAASALTSALLLNKLEIAQFDYALLLEYAIELMQSVKKTVQDDLVVTQEDAFSMMVNELTPRILHTNEYRDGRAGSEPVTRRSPLPTAGRYINIDGNPKEPRRGMLYLAKKDIRDWCASQRVDVRSLLDHAKAQGFLVSEGEKFNLTRGTELAAVQIVCVAFDMTKAPGGVAHLKLVHNEKAVATS